MESTTYDRPFILFTQSSMGKIVMDWMLTCYMVRNAGQLPQPFWLGAACGGGSCSAARCAART